MSKPTILFVDDETHIIQSLRRALHTAGRDWNLKFAQGGVEALTLMREAAGQGEPVDLLVSDMRMPGMSGAELLQHVMQEFPRTIRFILSGHSDQEMILQTVSTAHQFLAKPCEIEVLKQSILRAFALRHFLADSSLIGLAAGLQSLPTPQNLFREISEELGRPHSSLEKIGELIAHDPTISARILHLANSAFFGLPRQVSSVPEAVVFLGIQVVKAIILAIPLFEGYRANTQIGLFVQAVQEHSFQVAHLARHLCLNLDGSGKMAEESFIAGLLHDLGKMVFLRHQKYFPFVPVRALDEKKPLQDVEMDVFSCHHGALGAYVLGLWGLPDNVSEAAAWHHEPAAAPGNRLRPLVTVYLANFFVNQLTVDPRKTPAAAIPNVPFLETVGLWKRWDYIRELAGSFLRNSEVPR